MIRLPVTKPEHPQDETNQENIFADLRHLATHNAAGTRNLETNPYGIQVSSEVPEEAAADNPKIIMKVGTEKPSCK